MHILYYGVFDGRDWRSEYPMLAGLKALGNQIDTVNFRSRIPGTIARGIKRYGPQADLILVQNGIPLKPEKSRHFTSKPYVLFASEFALESHLPLLQAPRRPDFVIAHAESVDAWCKQEGIPVEHLPHAYNPNFYFPIEGDFRYDVTFIGGMTPRRTQILNRLKTRYGERMHVSTNWNPREINALYNQSRIVFHVHAKEERYLPTRLFEVMPTRACFVSESYGNRLPALYPDKASITYESFDEAVELIDKLLEDEASRRRIVSQAHSDAPRHTWAARMQDFMVCFKQATKHAQR